MLTSDEQLYTLQHDPRLLDSSFRAPLDFPLLQAWPNATQLALLPYSTITLCDGDISFLVSLYFGAPFPHQKGARMKRCIRRASRSTVCATGGITITMHVIWQTVRATVASTRY